MVYLPNDLAGSSLDDTALLVEVNQVAGNLLEIFCALLNQSDLIAHGRYVGFDNDDAGT